jgi:hypothetical protein
MVIPRALKKLKDVSIFARDQRISAVLFECISSFNPKHGNSASNWPKRVIF